MALRFGPIRLPWPPERVPDDPYWERFLQRPLHDSDNAFGEALRRLPEGNVFPQKSEVHSPEVTSAHVRELARFLGAPLCGIVRLAMGAADGSSDGLPTGDRFGIVCGLPTAYHPRSLPGMAGQVPTVQAGFVTYILAAYIRELGYHAARSGDVHALALAELAGLTAPSGERTELFWADVVCTDLPLAADCPEVFEWPPTS